MNAIMRKLVYDNPPTYAQYSSYRNYLRRVSKYACAYCTITESESPGATFNIEHFRPEVLFDSLKSTCTNLRYSCPRCNSYKGKLWIPEEDGCIRDCEKCTSKICRTEIERFIDVRIEDPSTMIHLGDDNKLYASSGSKPADYTIKYLRLNRKQLIKLRHVRGFMDSWKEDLLVQKEEAQKKLATVEEEQKIFLSRNFEPSTSKEQAYLGAIETMHAMLVLLAKQSLTHIEEEIRKLDQLVAYRTGSDSVIDE